MKRLSILSFFIFVLIGAVAQADPARFSAFGGVGYSAYERPNGDIAADRRSGSTLGAGIEAGLSDNIGLELGVQSVSNQVHIPLIARFWLGDTLTLGPGVYVGPEEGADLDQMEVGALGVLGLNFAMNDKTGIFVEGRYLRGFSDYQDAVDNRQVIRDDLLALAGVRFDLK